MLLVSRIGTGIFCGTGTGTVPGSGTVFVYLFIRDGSLVFILPNTVLYRMRLTVYRYRNSVFKFRVPKISNHSGDSGFENLNLLPRDADGIIKNSALFWLVPYRTIYIPVRLKLVKKIPISYGIFFY